MQNYHVTATTCPWPVHVARCRGGAAVTARVTRRGGSGKQKGLTGCQTETDLVHPYERPRFVIAAARITAGNSTRSSLGSQCGMIFAPSILRSSSRCFSSLVHARDMVPVRKWKKER